MSGYNARYTVTRDRLGDLRNGNGVDSTEAFGPSRTPGRSNDRSNYQTSYSNTYELESYSNQVDVSPVAKTDIKTMDGFFAEIDDLSSAIKIVQSNIDTITELHDSSLVSINENQWKQISNQLSQIVDDTSAINSKIKNRIKTLESTYSGRSKDSNANVNRAQIGRIKNEFITCIQRYREVESSFNKKYRQKVARQIRIVKQDVTEEELEAIIDSDQQNQIFAQRLLQNNRSGQAKAVLSEVQTRHDDIKKIERTILELAQLFQDLQMMIEDQGQVFDEVERKAEEATKDIEQGDQYVNKAVALARSTRAKRWCCFFIALILCVVIAILVWWFAFDHPGVGGGKKETAVENQTPAN